MSEPERGLYIVLVSLHGLIRGHDMELGRDADTGGQVLYVVELARALARHPQVERVDLLTRRVIDQKVSPDYAEPVEDLGEGARIVRIPFGPRRYLRKEVLWPHLDSFVDNALQHLRGVGRTPDLVHSHYADAGLAGARLAQLLGVPLVHTGHSLGREKRRRLLEKGLSEESVESQYNMSRRIEAEEIALGNASLVVVSTQQEVETQYSAYENYHPKRKRVIPPGVDLSRFHPPRRGEPDPPIAAELARFLRHPARPMILALSRPDERKNIATLVRAYGENAELRQAANLVVVAGNRDDITQMDTGARRVLRQLLLDIDRYDLYGRVAYPKHHKAADVPDLYRLAARRKGVFVNPALTEPFGLTLIEAAGCGLPLVATEDGGPRDIIANCRNGTLVNPLDADAIATALLKGLTDPRRWRQWSDNGIRGAHRHYTWESHVASYLKSVRRVLREGKPRRREPGRVKSRLPSIDRLLVCGLDNTLVGGDEGALRTLVERLRASGGRVGFGVATGRSTDAALKLLRQHDIPVPDVLISGVGSEIHYSGRQSQDPGWYRHIDYRWDPEALRAAMKKIPGLRPQPAREQSIHKISYLVDPAAWPGLTKVRAHLRRLDLHAKLIYSFDAFLDILPVRASKGLALRYLANKWGLPLERMLVAGDSGNDEEMLGGSVLGVVVANYSGELEHLRDDPRVYFAAGDHAAGILEAIDHYDFLGDVRLPDEEAEAS
ncbi:HAD-IIB family hydrolase [Thioalbus denitrificans]|uniref:sucrose-phosphate synthase n=1 Tax=Thioalbus denitrificans TaxID=547122 RepID=A0A369CI80_9GAMM|nr:HAD-IIB family hydrolase [Thioalbus denitrificans]RCX32795.1 sucrose-phosphate synthase [Thioalbus denitrificans]